VPEVECDIESVRKKIEESRKTDKKHFIIVVAEGYKDNVSDIAKYIENSTGIESRATILGHVQRGGSPSVRDRLAASCLGYAAVSLLNKGIGNRVVGYQDNKIVDFDIYEALNMTKTLDKEAYKLANILSL
jgi:6-phosphofructokinase 1